MNLQEQKQLFNLEQKRELSQEKLLEMLELQERLQKEVENVSDKDSWNNQPDSASSKRAD